MTRRWKSWSAALCAAVVAAALPFFPKDLAPTVLAAAASQSTADSASASASQIDELIKQCNEQMNVKGQFQLAAQLAEQALDLSQKAGDKVRASTALVYLGAALAYQGRLTEALEVTQRNLTLAREIGDNKILEQAFNTIAGVLGESGRYEDSLDYLYQCLDVARRIGDATMQYMSLLNIGEAYVRSGDPDSAEVPLQESLRLARGLKPNGTSSNPSKKGAEMALLNLGDMEAARQRYRLSLSYYERVHASRPESPLWVITALAGMANAHEQLGEPRQAIELLLEAMPLSEKAGSGLQYARLLCHLGVNQESLGQLEDALASQERALALVRQAGGNPDYEWQIESRLGHVQRMLGHPIEALEHYRTSIDGIERLRAVALNTEEGLAGVLAKSRDVYAETTDLLYETHRRDEAFAMAERGRARAFLDILAESRVGILDEPAPDQRQREDDILARISAAQREQWKTGTSDEDRKKTEAALVSAEEDLKQLHIEMRHSNPRYAGLRYPEPVSLGEIQRTLLDDRTALVEYLLGEKRSLVWVITKSTFESWPLPPRKEIEEQVAAYRKALGEPVTALTVDRSLIDVNRLGARLYRSVFEPIQGAVAAAQRIIIVPDGGLDYLPFEALVTGSRRTSAGGTRPAYLVENAAVVYGPSASALLAIQAMNREPAAPDRMLLAFGAPAMGATSARPAETAAQPRPARDMPSRERSATEDYRARGFALARLPYARDEVLAIGKLFDASQRQVYLGGAAREETLKHEKLETYRYIHFATHGFLDETKPGRSGILLAPTPSDDDGILQIGEIMKLRMNADLVTLSACSTGLGKPVNGEGILGLTRAMFYAGARNVAVSLWNVNDSATAALMTSFYRNLNEGSTQSEAMRRAKLTLLHGPHVVWQHPYFWAPFVIQGEGR